MQERGIKLFLFCALLLTYDAVGFAQDNKGKLNESLALTRQVLELERARKYDEAIPLAEKALKLAEEALGAESPSLSPSLNILASVYI
jgi:tetratricopeptide (TPR) repeat protein